MAEQHGRQGLHGASERHASVLSGISNLTNTIIGAGMLALPYAFATMGWLLGSVLLILCACATQLGLYLVKRCEVKLQNRSDSFYDMAVSVMPKYAWIFDAMIAIKCYGVCISYLMISGRLAPQVVSSFARTLHYSHADIPSFLLTQSVWIFVFTLALAPVCLARRLHSIRFAGYVNILAVVYLLVIMLYYIIAPGALKELPTGGDVSAVVFSSEMLRAVPVVVFAYTCAQNVLPLYNELQDDSEKTADLVTSVSVGASAAVYLVVALVGYVSFGSAVSDNIIAMYPDTGLFVCFGKLSVIALTLTSYPVQMHPARASVYKLLYPGGVSVSEVGASSLENGAVAERENAPGEQTPLVGGDAPRTIRGSVIRWETITLILMVTSVGVSLVVSDLSLVLGIVGAIGSTTISFILPPLLYLSVYRDEASLGFRRLCASLVVFGGIVMVTALAKNLLRPFGI